MDYVLTNGYTICNLTEESKGILDMLITCCNEADHFVFNILLHAVNENLAVNTYRISRVKSSLISLGDFKSTYKVNEIEALEKLFLHPVKEQMFSLLTNKINSGKITLDILYEKHKKTPELKLMRLIL